MQRECCSIVILINFNRNEQRKKRDLSIARIILLCVAVPAECNWISFVRFLYVCIVCIRTLSLRSLVARLLSYFITWKWNKKNAFIRRSNADTSVNPFFYLIFWSVSSFIFFFAFHILERIPRRKSCLQCRNSPFFFIHFQFASNYSSRELNKCIW